MAQIILVRHGQASFGKDNYDELSQVGHQQARHLGQWFSAIGSSFDHVVTGTMERQRATAKSCLANVSEGHYVTEPWLVDPGFNEYDHIEILARHRSDLSNTRSVREWLAKQDKPNLAYHAAFREAIERWMGRRYDEEYVESWANFRARVVEAVQRITLNAGAGTSSIVFTSAGVIAAICQHIMELTDLKTAELSYMLMNSSVTRLLYQPDRISISVLNSVAHLEWFGDSSIITYR
jgi:broad specificity phosphatase PhoE